MIESSSIRLRTRSAFLVAMSRTRTRAGSRTVFNSWTVARVIARPRPTNFISARRRSSSICGCSTSQWIARSNFCRRSPSDSVSTKCLISLSTAIDLSAALMGLVSPPSLAAARQYKSPGTSPGNLSPCSMPILAVVRYRRVTSTLGFFPLSVQ